MGHRVDFLTTATPGKTLTEVIDGVQVHRVRAYRRGVHEASVLGALSFVALAARQPGTRLCILSVSRLIARKGLDTLIAALASSQRPDLFLDMVGDGPIRASLQQLAVSFGVADRVRFHGFLEQPSLARLYAQADIFVLPSVAESCSMALLEAMAAGLPLIVTKVGGTIELVEHGYNGLMVGARNVDDLSAALQTLARDRAQRERFAAANRRLVRERFSWHSIARQYENIFEQSLKPRATKGSATGRAEQPPVYGDRTRK
jgi:glycosyltransferase involved in cell wall biosynthesis